MADILDRVIDIAKKLRKTARKSNDPALQNLITDLNLNLADLKLQLADLRQTPEVKAPKAAAPTAAPAPPKQVVSRPLGTTITSQTPDIGELRKFPD